MGARRRRRSGLTIQGFAPPVPVPPIAPAAPSQIPADLCAPNIIQQGFDAFSARPLGVCAPLISSADTSVASAKTLAAESLVHATEGWRYLSSALTSLLANSPKQAVHYAYYAELRAVISVLASYGLRVRYPNSAYVETTGASKRPAWHGEPTHKLVWRLWKDWAATLDAETLYLDRLKVHPSVTLHHFKDAISLVSASTSLTTWARDLELGNEHIARNTASYEAVYARESFLSMAAIDFEFVRDLWALAEPTAVGLQFEVQHVNWMLQSFAAKEELEELTNTGTYGAGERWLSRVLGEVERLTGVPKDHLSRTLSLTTPPSKIFDLAFSSSSEAQNIAARAFFLLRLSMLPIGAAFTSHPTTQGKAWLREWLAHAGIFDPTNGVLPMDIWADYEHLPSMSCPSLPLPNQLMSDASLAQNTLRMGRPDAVLAWSVPL